MANNAMEVYGKIQELQELIGAQTYNELFYDPEYMGNLRKELNNVEEKLYGAINKFLTDKHNEKKKLRR